MSLTAITKIDSAQRQSWKSFSTHVSLFALGQEQCTYPSLSEILAVTCGYQFLFTTLPVKTELTCPQYPLSDHWRVLMRDGHIQLPCHPASMAKASHRTSALDSFQDSRVRNSVHILISMDWNPAPTTDIYVNSYHAVAYFEYHQRSPGAPSLLQAQAAIQLACRAKGLYCFLSPPGTT